MRIDQTTRPIDLPNAAPCPAHCGSAPAASCPTPPHPHDVLDIAIHRRFGVEYQPLVDLRSGAIAGYEALARFHRADGEAVPPNVMFEALHENPLLLLHVEFETKRLQLAHAPEAPHLFINLDADSFHVGEGIWHNLFVDLFRRHRKQHPHQRITVEVTENLSIQDLQRSQEMISVLKGAGFGVALDDMGVAGTVVSYDTLSESTEVKFDRSWLVKRTPRRIDALQWFLGLCRAMEVRTVLEGIETPDDLAFARAAGFDWVQGFLFRDRFVRWHPSPA